MIWAYFIVWLATVFIAIYVISEERIKANIIKRYYESSVQREKYIAVNRYHIYVKAWLETVRKVEIPDDLYDQWLLRGDKYLDVSLYDRLTTYDGRLERYYKNHLAN